MECVTYEPKLVPTIQCQAGPYVESNSWKSLGQKMWILIIIIIVTEKDRKYVDRNEAKRVRYSLHRPIEVRSEKNRV